MRRLVTEYILLGSAIAGLAAGAGVLLYQLLTSPAFAVYASQIGLH